MAAGHAKIPLLITFWILALTCALKHNKHTNLNEKSSNLILITNYAVTNFWKRLESKCFLTRTRVGYAKSKTLYYKNCLATFNYQHL